MNTKIEQRGPTSAAHTPGPWIVGQQDPTDNTLPIFSANRGKSKRDICAVSPAPHWDGGQLHTAHRIVACVNAFADVADPAAELAELRRKVAAAEQMAEALKRCEFSLGECVVGKEKLAKLFPETLQKTRAALTAWKEASK